MAFAKFYNKSYLLVFYEDMGLMTFFLTECKNSYYEYVESCFCLHTMKMFSGYFAWFITCNVLYKHTHTLTGHFIKYTCSIAW